MRALNLYSRLSYTQLSFLSLVTVKPTIPRAPIRRQKLVSVVCCLDMCAFFSDPNLDNGKDARSASRTTLAVMDSSSREDNDEQESTSTQMQMEIMTAILPTYRYIRYTPWKIKCNQLLKILTAFSNYISQSFQVLNFSFIIMQVH